MSKLYANTINDNKLYGIKDVPSDDTIYELTETAAGSYRFSIYPPRAARVVARPNTLDGSRLQKVSNDPTKLFVTGFGMARNTGGEWVIDDRLDILLADNSSERNNVKEVIDVATGAIEQQNQYDYNDFKSGAAKLEQRPVINVREQIISKLKNMNDAQLQAVLQYANQVSESIRPQVER